MKKIIMSLLTLLTLLNITAFAQVQTTTTQVAVSASVATGVPVTSLRSADLLRISALGLPVRGSRSVNSASMDWDYPGRVTYISTNGVGAEDVLKKLFGVNMQYRLTNPNDKVNGYVYLYDSEDNVIFYGSAEYALALASGKGGGPTYGIWMWDVPVLSNVQSAEVLAIADDGTTANHYPLNVSGGHAMFQSWMAGAPNGLLAVRFKDGSLATYPLNNPVSQTPGTTTDVSNDWKIEGHYVYAPAGGTKIVKIIETWVLPTAYFEVGAGEFISFDVTGLVQMNGITTFEKPVSLDFIQIDGPYTGNVPLSGTTVPRLVFPVAGKYRVKFNWVNFGKPNTLYTGPTDGGKG